MADIPRSLWQFFIQLDENGDFATPGSVSGDVGITGDALTALQAIATGIGAPADVAGANTVIGQLKQIVINTTP